MSRGVSLWSCECVCVRGRKIEETTRIRGKAEKMRVFYCFFLSFFLCFRFWSEAISSSQHCSLTTCLYSCILILTHLLKLLTHSLAFLLTYILHVYSSSGQGVVVHRRKGHSNPTNDSFLISIIMSILGQIKYIVIGTVCSAAAQAVPRVLVGSSRPLCCHYPLWPHVLT
jgi:hypothetical protein